jgi:O-antigen ligase
VIKALTKIRIKNILIVPVFLFGLYPLIPHRLEGLTVITLLIFSLIAILPKQKRRRQFKVFFVMSLVYWTFLIGVLMSENLKELSNKMETMLSLAVIPVIFYLFLGTSKSYAKSVKKLFFRSYYISNLVFALYSFYLFFVYTNPRYLKADANFFRMAILENKIVGEHPIYVSIFISVAIIIGFSFFRKEKIICKKNGLFFFTQSLLFILLFLLMSKGVIIALLISLLVLYIKNNRIRISHILSGIVLLVIVFISIPQKNNRFAEIIKGVTYKKIDMYNSTSIRIRIYQCGFELLQERPLVGYGIGDVQDELDKCYEKYDSNFVKGRYNSHNQYLFAWLSSGLIGIIAILFFLSFCVRMSVKYKDSIMLSILVLYSVVFLFENVLSRQSGVIFFSFVVNFFLWYNLNKEKSKVEENVV